jgi:hypothetical protein
LDWIFPFIDNNQVIFHCELFQQSSWVRFVTQLVKQEAALFFKRRVKINNVTIVIFQSFFSGQFSPFYLVSVCNLFQNGCKLT